MKTSKNRVHQPLECGRGITQPKWHHVELKESLWGSDAPNMLKNLPIIPSRTSQNVSLLFFKIPPIIPKLFRSDSKKITAI